METIKPMYTVHQGRRYRLKFRNASDDIHPLHLHRHSFELTRIAGKPTAGVIKDMVMLGGYEELEFDFVADNPGLTLFYCHQQRAVRAVAAVLKPKGQIGVVNWHRRPRVKTVVLR